MNAEMLIIPSDIAMLFNISLSGIQTSSRVLNNIGANNLLEKNIPDNPRRSYENKPKCNLPSNDLV